MTIELLDEHGYDRLTVDEVAARAHASKATIYRRWPSKAVLITAALAARMDASALAEPMHQTSRRDELLHHQRLLITHEPVDDTLPERIVDELMLPLLT